MTELELFLQDKPLYYKAFDPLRMKHAYESIKNDLKLPKVIHIVGTNGKGSTGRYLAQMLLQTGLSVGHYTSPHIIRFNERIWLNGKEAETSLLNQAFKQLISLLDAVWQESLSYFEFTTLLAMTVFESCDFVVLEAGLGGEYDATAVFENLFTIVTPIGLDHKDFLGDSITAVATTKIKAVRHEAVVAKQEDPLVYKVAKELSAQRGFILIQVDDMRFNHEDQVLLEAMHEKLAAAYLFENFKTALIAFRKLSDQKVDPERIETIFGRLTHIESNITVDVGHNILAAEKILKHFGKSKVNLVYNSLQDKEYEKILTLLQPIISCLEIIGIDDERAVDNDRLIDVLDQLKVPYQIFQEVKPENNYLVFGSFTVVEAFLKRLHG